MKIYQASHFKMIQTIKNSLLGLCLHTQRIVDIIPYSQLCCLPYWFAEEHNCDMHPYSTKSHYVKYAGSVTSEYVINTISSCVLVFHCHHQSIYWYLSQHSMDGYEAMGCNVTQFTQDVEQSLFTMKTNMPIPMLVYGDSFQWSKYGHHILPSNLDLTSHNKKQVSINFLELLHWVPLQRFRWKSTTIKSRSDKPYTAGLHQTFWKSLVEFLCTDFLIEFFCTDLDENLSFTLNPLTDFKLDYFLSTLFEGLS